VPWRFLLWVMAMLAGPSLRFEDSACGCESEIHPAAVGSRFTVSERSFRECPGSGQRPETASVQRFHSGVIACGSLWEMFLQIQSHYAAAVQDRGSLLLFGLRLSTGVAPSPRLGLAHLCRLAL
jgi:hypothetical protein